MKYATQLIKKISSTIMTTKPLEATPEKTTKPLDTMPEPVSVRTRRGSVGPTRLLSQKEYEAKSGERTKQLNESMEKDLDKAFAAKEIQNTSKKLMRALIVTTLEKPGKQVTNAAATQTSDQQNKSSRSI
jgi:hypothetical protein